MRWPSSSRNDRKALATTRMDRIFSKGTLLVLGIAGIIIFLASMFRKYPWTTEIRATVSPREIILGDTLFYKDSTLGTDQVTWEFGNGEISSDKQGAYVLTSPGAYVVSVKAGSKTDFFPVRVHAATRKNKKKSLRIIGPHFAIEDEIVIFFTKGEEELYDWHWKPDRCDRYGGFSYNNEIASFKDAGDYRLSLLSKDMKDTAYHTIHIERIEERRPVVCCFPTKYRREKGTIRDQLQRLIERKGRFEETYQHLISMLEGYNKTIVLVNDKREYDLYSYCSYLHLQGKADGVYIEDAEYDRSDGKRRLLVQEGTEKDRLNNY